MSVFEILYIVGLGFWLPLFALAVFYWVYVGRYSRYRDRDVRELYHNLQRDSERSERYLPRILEELPHRLESQLSELLGREIREAVGSLHATLTAETKKEDPRQNSTKQLIRELGHSLNTPLSQIEASVLALRARSNEPELASMNLGASLSRIIASVDICKSVIAAFRELVVVTSSSSGWSPSSIRQALRAASDVYMESYSRQLDVELNMPEEIHGYSSNFIVALILPLLENAIEASPDNERIAIFGQKRDQSFEILVTNRLQQPLPNHDMYEHGFTTKKGHDGVGLSTVKHLLLGLRGAHVDHSADGEKVSFTVALPVRE
ncbi:MAG: HAMP domain-containing histidine kinase [Candidatus Tectomicrobia bacterium]|nr:HAMP domain-containing histidine kinase [Candidatus Tectomicrobia bacterium]